MRRASEAMGLKGREGRGRSLGGTDERESTGENPANSHGRGCCPPGLPQMPRDSISPMASGAAPMTSPSCPRTASPPMAGGAAPRPPRCSRTAGPSIAVGTDPQASPSCPRTASPPWPVVLPPGCPSCPRTASLPWLVVLPLGPPSCPSRASPPTAGGTAPPGLPQVPRDSMSPHGRRCCPQEPPAAPGHCQMLGSQGSQGPDTPGPVYGGRRRREAGRGRQEGLMNKQGPGPGHISKNRVK